MNCENALPVKSKIPVGAKIEPNQNTQWLHHVLLDCVRICYVGALWDRGGCGIIEFV